MFDRLRRGDQAGIEDCLIRNVADHFVGFFKNAVDRRTVYAFRFLTDRIKRLFQGVSRGFRFHANAYESLALAAGRLPS